MSKTIWVNPEKDEMLQFDLPDGAQQMQVGARCPTCGSGHSLVAVTPRDRKAYACGTNQFRGPITAHNDWPGVTYRFETVGDELVAKVYEGDAPPVVVHGAAYTGDLR